MRLSNKYFNMNFGSYCGLLLEKDLARKMGKLLYKQQEEIKDLLVANIESTEISDWGLIYPHGKQTDYRYFIKSTEDEKLERVTLIDRCKLMEIQKDVFTGDEIGGIKKEAFEHYFKSVEVEE